MMLQFLPIGIQDFRSLREDGYLYVDKTQLICQLTGSGKFVFLARPRRFGKSLLMSTIKELYSGDTALFKGLWVENNWDWNKRNPVIHIAFNAFAGPDIVLERALIQELNSHAAEKGISLTSEGLSVRFAELLKKIHEQTGKKVVVLIDEYDKPLIDYLDNIEKAVANRQVLKGFYGVLKPSDPHIEFCLITGVSKFSRVSIFSDLNNLEDITMVPDYSTITGYTQHELEANFAGHIDQFASETGKSREQLLDILREWYNGYSWNPAGPTLYNPFSVMLALKQRRIFNFWFETGTPTFLVNFLKKSFNTQLEDFQVGAAGLESYDIESLSIIPILFQTGYLTIASEDGGMYTLRYPNREVKESLLLHLLAGFRHEEVAFSMPLVRHLQHAFRDNNIAAVMEQLNTAFATIPYQHFEANREGYYHSLIHLLFQLVGLDVRSEVHNSRGRLDVMVQTDTRVFIFEFKLDQSADAALQQIHDRGYADAYRKLGKELVLVGVNFDSGKKEVGEWKVSA